MYKECFRWRLQVRTFRGGKRRRSKEEDENKPEGSISGSFSTNITGWPLSRAEWSRFMYKTAAFLSHCRNRCTLATFLCSRSSRSKRADASSKAWLSKRGTNRLCGKLRIPFCHKKGKGKKKYMYIYMLVCQFLILCCHLVAKNKISILLQFSSVSRI